MKGTESPSDHVLWFREPTTKSDIKSVNHSIVVGRVWRTAFTNEFRSEGDSEYVRSLRVQIEDVYTNNMLLNLEISHDSVSDARASAN